MIHLLMDSARPAPLEPPIVRYGYLAGLIAEVVQIKLTRLKDGLLLSELEERRALLIREELDCVGDIVRLLPAEQGGVDSAHFWTYVKVRSIRRRWDALKEPWDELAEQIESCGEPREYVSFIYFREVGPGERARPRTQMPKELDEQLAIDELRYRPRSVISSIRDGDVKWKGALEAQRGAKEMQSR